MKSKVNAFYTLGREYESRPGVICIGDCVITSMSCWFYCEEDIYPDGKIYLRYSNNPVNFNFTSNCTGDFDKNGVVGFNDVLTLLSAFGTDCQKSINKND